MDAWEEKHKNLSVEQCEKALAHYKRSKHTANSGLSVYFIFFYALIYLFCIPLLGLWRKCQHSIAINYTSISLVWRSQGCLLLFPQLIYNMHSHHFQGAFTPLHICCSSFSIVAVLLNQLGHWSKTDNNLAKLHLGANHMSVLQNVQENNYLSAGKKHKLQMCR